jgi:hypothetical protein
MLPSKNTNKIIRYRRMEDENGENDEDEDEDAEMADAE